MRNVLMIGLAIGAVAVCGVGLFLVLHHPDPLVEGTALMNKGDMHRASLYLREAVRNHPDNADAAWRLGVVDLALSNPAAAELELKRARQHGYDAGKILLPLGQAYLQQHHYEQLLKDFDPGSAPRGSLGDVDALRSAAELALGNMQAAQDDASAAIAAAPNAAVPKLASARVALARNDLAGAAAILDGVLKADPKQADALLLRGGIAISQGKPQVALDDADTVLLDNPRRIDAKLMKVRALAVIGREKEARDLVDDVLHAAPHDASANYLRMVLAVRSHDWQAANASLENISPVVANLPRGLFYAGLVKLNVGQPAQAEEAVSKFLTTHPDDLDAHKLMAFIALTSHRPADARAQLQDIVAAGHPDAETLTLMGRAQAMAGDGKDAEATLAKAQALAPNNLDILNRLASVRLSLGETAMADQDLRQSLAVDPHQAKTGETLVRGLLERGDTRGAADALAKLKQALGDTEVTSVLQAEIQIAAYDLPGAQDTLQLALKHFPDSQSVTLLLVRVDGRLGQVDAAEALLTALLHRHPADEPALQMQLPLLLAQGKTGQAVAFAEAAHAAAPGKPAIVVALANTYLQAHDPDRAIALLDRAAAAGQNPALTLLRARALVSAKRLDAARDAYRELLEAVPGSDEPRRELALLQVADDDAEGARGTLRDGLHIAPGNMLLMSTLVGVDLKTGGTAAALRTAAALAADAANLPGARLLAGDIWMTAKDPARAADAYLTAYKAAPSSTLVAHAADAMAHAGRLRDADALLTAWLGSHPDDVTALSVLTSLELLEKKPDAESRLQHLVTLRPADAAALNNLAWLRGQQGDYADALALAKRAYFIAPQPSTADTLGWIMARSGDTVGALPLLQKASDAGHAPDQLYHYAAVLAQAGQKDKAKPILQKVLAQKANFDERADAEKLLERLGS
jgi:putative PEP-CTERM system TPR-repeat lipoprotein